MTVAAVKVCREGLLCLGRGRAANHCVHGTRAARCSRPPGLSGCGAGWVPALAAAWIASTWRWMSGCLGTRCPAARPAMVVAIAVRSAHSSASIEPSNGRRALARTRGFQIRRRAERTADFDPVDIDRPALPHPEHNDAPARHRQRSVCGGVDAEVAGDQRTVAGSHEPAKSHLVPLTAAGITGGKSSGEDFPERGAAPFPILSADGLLPPAPRCDGSICRARRADHAASG